MVITLFYHAVQAGLFSKSASCVDYDQDSVLLNICFFTGCFFDSKLFTNWVAIERRFKKTLSVI